MSLASGLHSSKSASNNRVRGQVESGEALELETGVVREQGGTVNLSAVDAAGNMAALTITHGTPPRDIVTQQGLSCILILRLWVAFFSRSRCR